MSADLKNAILATLVGEMEGRSIAEIAAPIQIAEALSVAVVLHPDAIGDVHSESLQETPKAFHDLHEAVLTPYMEILRAVCALEAVGLLEPLENGCKSRITKRGLLHIVSLIACARLAKSGEDLGDVSGHLFEEV
ncbi:MAG TPA: hypothetical protein VKZ53_12970 [Candidatus Angelobacter sp.]|nr:hypothetical protein [Candidatus Angelobacter sp.]